VVPVLDDISFEVPAGGYLAITGPSGVGKSTLLALLGGLERAHSGSITVAGHDLARLSPAALARFRSRTIGFVFQHYGLMEALTARENVQLAMSLAGWERAAREARAAMLLDRVGLSGRAAHLPGRLSGGEQQRVAVARALATRPSVILADEPTGNLDDGNADRVMSLLEEGRQAYGCTLVVVTHDRAVADRAGTRLDIALGRLRAA
jgi:putative ABC transport system ATP-binding protein